MATFAYLKERYRSGLFFDEGSCHILTLEVLARTSTQLHSLVKSLPYEWLIVVDDSDLIRALVRQLQSSSETRGWVRYLIIDRRTRHYLGLDQEPATRLMVGLCPRLTNF